MRRGIGRSNIQGNINRQSSATSIKGKVVNNRGLNKSPRARQPTTLRGRKLTARGTTRTNPAVAKSSNLMSPSRGRGGGPAKSPSLSSRGRGRAGRSVRGQQQGRGSQNQSRGASQNSRGRGQNSRGRGSNSRGRGSNSRGRGRGGQNPKVSKEDLDKQLDQYMAGTKHTLDKELDNYMNLADVEMK